MPIDEAANPCPQRWIAEKTFTISSRLSTSRVSLCWVSLTQLVRAKRSKERGRAHRLSTQGNERTKKLIPPVRKELALCSNDDRWRWYVNGHAFIHDRWIDWSSVSDWMEKYFLCSVGHSIHSNNDYSIRPFFSFSRCRVMNIEHTDMTNQLHRYVFDSIDHRSFYPQSCSTQWSTMLRQLFLCTSSRGHRIAQQPPSTSFSVTMEKVRHATEKWSRSRGGTRIFCWVRLNPCADLDMRNIRWKSLKCQYYLIARECHYALMKKARQSMCWEFDYFCNPEWMNEYFIENRWLDNRKLDPKSLIFNRQRVWKGKASVH